MRSAAVDGHHLHVSRPGARNARRVPTHHADVTEASVGQLRVWADREVQADPGVILEALANLSYHKQYVRGDQEITRNTSETIERSRAMVGC